MKKSIVMTLAIGMAAAISFAGCGKAADSENISRNAATENSEDEQEEVNEKTGDVSDEAEQSEAEGNDNGEIEELSAEDIYMAAYGKVLDDWCKACDSQFDDEFCFDEEFGLEEASMGAESVEDIYDNVGYVLYDLNTDGIPELYMTGLDRVKSETETVFAAYGVDGSEAVNLFYGWARNRYLITTDGLIGNMGSSGAAYTTLAVYSVDKGSSRLKVNDYYFTYPTDDENIGVYYNTTGSSDMEESEDRTGEDGFDRLWDKVENETRSFQPVPLGEYKKTGEITVLPQRAVQAKKDVAASAKGDNYDSHSCVDNPQTTITLYATENVKNLKVLKLTIKDVSEDGKVTYDSEELYSQSSLLVIRPLDIGITFYGDLPEYGISYTKADGTTENYAIYESGYDGSIVMEKFED